MQQGARRDEGTSIIRKTLELMNPEVEHHAEQMNGLGHLGLLQALPGTEVTQVDALPAQAPRAVLGIGMVRIRTIANSRVQQVI